MKTKETAMYGLLVALAMILSYIETLFPVFVAVPGVKLGLANIVVLFAVYTMGIKSAAAISAVRVLLAGFMFGNLFSIIYSGAGACLSLLVIMILYKSGKFGITGVSVAGGVAHNAGQIIVACFVTETAQIAYYFPVLCISGTVAGICIGLIAGLVIGKMKGAALKD
ncbi:MAG: Gx transporter family protein [Clostridia bacterium]|nr:Gx transporter family protein [Clostridia bacterium]